ncbi:MAG: hypothetical protein HOW73_36580 [Polyangiaceae bacterium]|nr:hypothetical protein [Polyangiaceae bacterium]
MSAPDGKRRLPVIKETPEGEEPPPEERPGSQWVWASAIITVLLWTLVSGGSNAILQRAGVESVGILVGVSVGSLFVAALVGGLATGRFGLKAERKHATYGTVAAAAFGWVLSISAGLNAAPIPFWFAVLAVLGGLAWGGGVLGYRLGKRLRPA